MHIRIIMYKIKAKKKTLEKRTKQTRKTINSKAVTGIVEKPRENSEMCENVKVSNN